MTNLISPAIEIKDPEGITRINPSIAETIPDLELINDIVKGERRLIEKSDVYLPQDPAETDSGYQSRLKRASLTNFVKKIRNVATAMVLKKPFVIEDDSLNLAEFATKEGQSLKTFSKNLLRAAWQEGYSICFVDFPKLNKEINTLAEEQAIGARPYLEIIKRHQVMDFQTELRTTELDGQRYYLSNLSYLKTRIALEERGGKEPAIMEYMTMPEANTRWRLWRIVESSKTSKEWKMVEEGDLSIDFIPASPLYIDQEGVLDAELPLLDIANLSRHHFSVNSDVFQLLHLIANPKLALYGVDRNEMDFSSSANVGLIFEDPTSKMEWTALTGVSTDPLETKLDKIEQAILSSVLQLFQPKKQAESGIAKEIDREENTSVLMLAAEGLERCLNLAFIFAGAYSNAVPAEVSVNKTFRFSSVSPQDLQGLIQMFLADLLTNKTLLEKLESSGFFDGINNFSVEQELEALQ